jgi:hypothetical protein
MSYKQPAADCGDVNIVPACALTAPAQVALEDYARVLTRARAAETVGNGSDAIVSGVHLCGLPSPISDAARQDVVDFAHDLSARESSGGLGWS